MGYSGYLVPTIPPGIILFLFLPALTFEPALQIDLRQLRQHIVPVLTMAVGGVITTAGVVGLAVWWLTPLDLASKAEIVDLIRKHGGERGK